MLSSLKQLWQILSPLDKRKVIYVFILVMGMAFIESAGVISIMPFLAVLSNPNDVESNFYLKQLYEFTGAANKQNFIFNTVFSDHHARTRVIITKSVIA